MKTRTYVLVMCGLLTLLSGAALSANEGDLKFVVPFSFATGAKTLPAGTYRVALTHPGSGHSRHSRRARRCVSGEPETRVRKIRRVAAPGVQIGITTSTSCEWCATPDRSYALPETMQEREASTLRNGMHASIPEVVAVQAVVAE